MNLPRPGAIATLGLMHEDAYVDSLPLTLLGIDSLESRATEAIGRYVRDATRLRGNIGRVKGIIAANRTSK